MGIKKYKPTTSGRRGSNTFNFSEISKSNPEKSLITPLNKKAGRTKNGKITVRHRGGGHKRMYRLIDFRRNSNADKRLARVAHIEYDPNRNARIALLHYVNGKKSYILAPEKIKIGDVLNAKQNLEIQVGNSLTLSKIPVGTTVHAVELKPKGGAKLARAAGASAQLIARDSKYAQLRLPSGEIRNIDIKCQATIGSVGNIEKNNLKLGKAGRKRWLGFRPSVRGVAMNPVDHPHGGGEGKTSGGRHPVNPHGLREKKTRKIKKISNSMIIRNRNFNKNKK